MNRYETIILSFWHRIIAFFNRVWRAITDRDYIEAVLEADKSEEVVPFKFTTRPNIDEQDNVEATRKESS